MDRDVRVVGAGRDGKWMPLVIADIRAVEEKPLSGLVLHARLGELDLNSIVRVADDLDDLCLAPAADLSVEAVEKIKATTDKLPSPTFVTDTMGPEVVMIERRKSRGSVTDEAASRVRVHAEKEWDKQVMCVPKRLERLLSDPVMSCGIDQEHTQQHDVSCDATSLCVVNLKSDLGSDLHTFNVEKATFVSLCLAMSTVCDLLDVMRCYVEDSEEEHGVSHLSMKPLRFIKRQKARLGSEPSEDISAHGHDDNHGVD